LILQSLEELERDLSNEMRPVYLVLGPERYQCRLALSMLRKHALSPGAEAFDYSEFDAGNASIADIMEAAGTFPMISKRRLVLAINVEKLKDADQEELLGSVQRLSKRSMLVLFAEELDHRKRFYKTLRDRNCVAEFPKLKGIALEHWAEALIRKQGYRASPATIKRIVELAGADLQTLASELEKLMLSSGKEKEISSRALDDLIQSSRQQGIFDLINAIGKRDRVGSLKSLANLLSMGEPPLLIVVMMARHCRQVLIAKEGIQQGNNAQQIGSAAQIPPFMLDQFLRQARAADAPSIQEMFIRLAAIDKSLKSSKLDARMMLESLICALV
jgi:DNA polymerase III subunit delta